MIKIMLNNLKSGLVVLGLFVMVGVAALTFGFKGAAKANATEKSTKIFATQWYTLSSTGAAQSSQIIGAAVGTAPNTPDCNATNTGFRCAVQINFDGAAPSPGAVVGQSVATVLSTYPNSSVTASTLQPE